MKRKFLIFLFALPAFLVAGAWTGLGVAPAHVAAGHSALASYIGYASALVVKASDLASRIPEQACFLALGACFISVGWALHRKSAKRGH
jgi:hypothetical protein